MQHHVNIAPPMDNPDEKGLASPSSVDTAATDSNFLTSNARINLVKTAVVAALIYYGTSLVVFSGVAFGQFFVILCRDHPDSHIVPANNDTALLAVWDGVWYHGIVEEGYSYDPDRMSNVAFFPLYPLTAAVVRQIFNVSTHDALYVTSQVYLVISFILFYWYVLGRSGGTPTQSFYSVLALGLLPITFWMRMSYTESCFLATALLAMIAMQRQWNLLVIALICGLCTAGRPVGVALTLPFIAHLWTHRMSNVQFLWNSCLLLPICGWGLAAYAIFQGWQFGDPIAFMRTQVHWHERPPLTGWWSQIVQHVTLEPVWNVYDPSSPGYWNNDAPHDIPLFSMQFLNPIVMLVAWGLVAWGTWRKHLTITESLLSLGMFSITYLTHAAKYCMVSEARYTSAVFPIYILCGVLMSRLPSGVVNVMAAISAVFLAMFAALFTRWYWFY